VSERHRVAVNPDGTRYQVQQRIQTPQGEVWVPRAYASLSALLKAQASKVEGLAIACKGLPEKPSEAVPLKLRAGRAAVLQAIQASDTRRKSNERKKAARTARHKPQVGAVAGPEGRKQATRARPL
jgi:hypothetical protein